MRVRARASIDVLASCSSARARVYVGALSCVHACMGASESKCACTCVSASMFQFSRSTLQCTLLRNLAPEPERGTEKGMGLRHGKVVRAPPLPYSSWHVTRHCTIGSSSRRWPMASQTHTVGDPPRPRPIPLPPVAAAPAPPDRPSGGSGPRCISLSPSLPPSVTLSLSLSLFLCVCVCVSEKLRGAGCRRSTMANSLI